jgi:hypothetical protein
LTRQISYYCCVAFILFCVVFDAKGAPLAVSTFTTGVEGWDSYSFGAFDDGFPNFTRSFGGAIPVTYDPAAGGNSAFISAQDPDAGWQYFRAGPAFLGNQAAALGGTFVFDITRLDSFVADPINNPAASPVALSGGNLVLVYTGNVPTPTVNTWATDSIPLVADGSWKVNDPTGAAATTAQLSKALSNLTGFFILGDWFFGAGPTDGDTYGVDNVSLNAGPVVNPIATPEPSTALLLGGAILGLAVLRSRRRAQ